MGVFLYDAFSFLMFRNTVEGCLVENFLLEFIALANCFAECGARLWVVLCDEVRVHLCLGLLFVRIKVHCRGSVEMLKDLWYFLL